jgi:hypothetical protein
MASTLVSKVARLLDHRLHLMLFVFFFVFLFYFISLFQESALLVDNGGSCSTSGDVPSSTAGISVTPNTERGQLADTHDLVGVKAEAGELSCVPAVVDVLDSVSDGDNAKLVADGQNRDCGEIILDASDDLRFNPRVEFNDK